jgi:chitodextrinase
MSEKILKYNILPITITVLLMIGGFISAGSKFDDQISDNNNFNEINYNQIGKNGILFSRINVKVYENTKTDIGGYTLSYILFGIGNHNIFWDIDYLVWFSSGDHERGIQTGVGRKISIGPLLISFGRTSFYWDNFNAGYFQAKLLSNGNVTDSDIDEDEEYDGEFGGDSGDVYIGSVDEFIQFQGTAMGGTAPYTWLWDFGDKNTSTEQNPKHIYTEEGDYTVSLKVTDYKNTTSTDQTEAKIKAKKTEFTAYAGDNYQGLVGEPINFEGNASGGIEPYTWLWDFGEENMSTEQEPYHTYINEGVYEVTLTVNDSMGVTAFDKTEAVIIERYGIE